MIFSKYKASHLFIVFWFLFLSRIDIKYSNDENKATFLLLLILYYRYVRPCGWAKASTTSGCDQYFPGLLRLQFPVHLSSSLVPRDVTAVLETDWRTHVQCYNAWVMLQCQVHTCHMSDDNVDVLGNCFLFPLIDEFPVYKKKITHLLIWCQLYPKIWGKFTSSNFLVW